MTDYRAKFNMWVDIAHDAVIRSSDDELKKKSEMKEQILEKRIVLTQLMESFQNYRCPYKETVIKNRIITEKCIPFGMDENIDVIWYAYAEGSNRKNYLIKVIMKHKFQKIGVMKNVDHLAVTYEVFARGNEIAKNCYCIDDVFSEVSGKLVKLLFTGAKDE